MRIPFKAIAVIPITIACLAAGWTLLTPQPRAEPAPSPIATPKFEIKDPRPAAAAADPATTDWGRFAVQLFAYLNLPADPAHRGQPIPNKPVAVDTATVWESFKNTTEIFRPDGSTPCPWETNCELPPATPAQETALKKQLADLGPVNSNWIHFLAEDRMIDGLQIVNSDDPNNYEILRYDVKVNQDYFNYVAQNPQYELYNLNGQEAALDDTGFTFNFPAGTVELKACWRILEPADDESKYWTAVGCFYDINHVLRYEKIGLSAIHVISKSAPNWVWMTWEQNSVGADTYKMFLGKPEKVVGPNLTWDPRVTDEANALWQGFVAGTPWANYRVIGWQTEFVDASGTPTVMANSQIETYFQESSSCLSCHVMANIGPWDQRRLNMWASGRPGIEGRVGEVNFPAIAAELAPGKTFKQMDHVWSLRQARPKAAP